jgi:hypothetical protein
MKKATIVKVVGGLGAVGLAVGITGGVVGAAQAAGQSADSTAAAADQSCERDGRGAGHRGGTALTGDALAEATAAAQEAVPGGTVLRAAQDADGAIHVHVTRSDGTHVVVRMDEAYQVTSVDELADRGGRGHRGGGAPAGAGADPSSADA